MKNFALFYLMLITFVGCESTNYRVIRNGVRVSKTIPTSTNEFERLMEKDKIGKTQRNGEVVSQLINEKPSDKSAAITIENTTNCNIVVRILGAKNYLLPIYKNDKNFILIDKGNYTFSSDFCRAKYYKQKSITESVVITLSEYLK
ncbi:DUF6759 domain-containing protein [Halpernia frigidisoli]|uniref:DUF6759 domain-containing protein n=1 Tax=Halpernia frigidisoli TaxID=1125876 RepID=A0A1I3FPF1_9FLAO|nr:DUF6759 domain-containing protein [Halpernia frigidisoli]SFI13036.1 hypothetical protein SAMN05443292_1522 [Halpernia frigidisoli]